MIPFSVSAIVCAYNEAKTIKPILEVLVNHPKIDEVITVDDGSKDKTWKIMSEIKNNKFFPIHHPKNLGKGAAVADAVKKSRGEILLFVDADLYNFHPAHVDLLLNPLQIDDSIMTIGVRETGSLFEKNFRTFLKSFGGERAIHKRYLIAVLKRVQKSGYGVEAVINFNHLHRKHKIVYIPLPNLIHKAKTEKHPIYKYITEYIKENTEVIKQYFDPENKVLEGFFNQIAQKLRV